MDIKIGQRFGKVTIVEYLDGLAVNGHDWVKCQCDCGETFYSTVLSLRNGTVTMCKLCSLKQQYQKRRIVPQCRFCGKPITRGKYCSERCEFLDSMIPTDTDCVEFKSDTASVFPTFRGEYAFVKEWEYLHGKVPSGFKIIHDCNNPRCVNPQHTKLVSLEETPDEVENRSAYQNIDIAVKRYKNLKHLEQCTHDFVSKKFINESGRFLFEEFRDYFGFATVTAWCVKKRLGLSKFPNYYIRSSMAQSELFDWIPFKHKTLNERGVIPPNELDIYLPDQKIAIEYDGVYWHDDTTKNLKKYERTKELGIRFFDIFEFESPTIWKSVLSRVFDCGVCHVSAECSESNSKELNSFLADNSFAQYDDVSEYYKLTTDFGIVGAILRTDLGLRIVQGNMVRIDNIADILISNFKGDIIVLNNRYERPSDYVSNYVVTKTIEPKNWFVYSRKIYTDSEIEGRISRSKNYDPTQSLETNLRACKANHLVDLGYTCIQITP